MTTYKCSSCRTVLTPIMYQKTAILICKLCGKQHQYPAELAAEQLEAANIIVEPLFFPLGAINPWAVSK